MINVLDHGYVSEVTHWGSDEDIIAAARMSTGKGFLGWGPRHIAECPQHYLAPGNGAGCECPGGPTPEGDEKLLRYLWENKHHTPFEMAGLTIEVKAPIFVFREWHRHRTQSYNEQSARYVPLPDENYIPSVERLMINAGTNNKQAGAIAGAAVLTTEVAEAFRSGIAEMYKTQESVYQAALSAGIPKELARIHLPVGRYSRMRASANLRNWLAFLKLRMDSAAQWEIRQYANAIGGHFVARYFPRTWELFRNG